MASSSPALALALALALVATFAAAHGATFSADPTLLNLTGHLASDRSILLESGAEGAVYFAAVQPGAAPTPLDFALKAPLRFAPHGAEVAIALRADKPVLARDANGNGLRIELLLDGRPIPGASSEQPLPLKLGPDEASGVRATLGTNVTEPIAENATLTLRLTPLMPALLDEALAVVVGGGAGSTLLLPLITVPTVQDLRLQDAPFYEYDLTRENFTPIDRTLAVNEFDVEHETITTNFVNVFGTRAFLVFKGAESSADAQQDHAFVDRAKRLAATHDFRVGTTLVRVHPGVGVVVLLDLASGPTLVKCVQHCPAAGFEMTIHPARVNQKPGDPGTPVDGAPPSGAPTATPTTGSVLVPPPSASRATEPTQKATPGAPIAAALALAFACSFALRRRP